MHRSINQRQYRSKIDLRAWSAGRVILLCFNAWKWRTQPKKDQSPKTSAHHTNHTNLSIDVFFLYFFFPFHPLPPPTSTTTSRQIDSIDRRWNRIDYWCWWPVLLTNDVTNLVDFRMTIVIIFKFTGEQIMPQTLYLFHSMCLIVMHFVSKFH